MGARPRPERKRRDWWVIGGLFLGGLAALWVFSAAFGVVTTVVPQARIARMAMRAGRSARALRAGLRYSSREGGGGAGSMGLERILYVCLGLLLLYLAIDEAFLAKARADDRRKGRAPGTVTEATPNAIDPDLWDVTLTFNAANGKGTFKCTVEGLSLGAAPVVGQPLPEQVRYNTDDPDDGHASPREAPVFWGDVAWLVGLGMTLLVVFLGLPYWQEHALQRQAAREQEEAEYAAAAAAAPQQGQNTTYDAAYSEGAYGNGYPSPQQFVPPTVDVNDPNARVEAQQGYAVYGNGGDRGSFGDWGNGVVYPPTNSPNYDPYGAPPQYGIAGNRAQGY